MLSNWLFAKPDRLLVIAAGVNVAVPVLLWSMQGFSWSVGWANIACAGMVLWLRKRLR